jgi:hypothetical protein
MLHSVGFCCIRCIGRCRLDWNSSAALLQGVVFGCVRRRLARTGWAVSDLQKRSMPFHFVSRQAIGPWSLAETAKALCPVAPRRAGRMAAIDEYAFPKKPCKTLHFLAFLGSGW